MKTCRWLLVPTLALALAAPWAVAQTEPAALAAPDVGGRWVGFFPGSTTRGVELRLTQDGDLLQGYATVNPGDEAAAVVGELGGRVSPDGAAQLDVAPLPPALVDELAINVSFLGTPTADVFDGNGVLVGSAPLTRANLENPPDPEASRLRLWEGVGYAIFSSISPNERYRLSFKDNDRGTQAQAADASLQRQVFDEAVGPWNMQDASAALGTAPFSYASGRVAAWNPQVSRGITVIAFKDASSILGVVTTRFNNIASGRTGDTRDFTCDGSGIQVSASSSFKSNGGVATLTGP